MRLISFTILLVCFFASVGTAQHAPATPATEAQQGALAFQKKDFHAAENYFLRALKADPGLVNVRSQLAQAYYYDHKYTEAIKEYNQVLRRDSSAKGVEPYRSLSMAAVGDCEEAIPGLKRQFSSDASASLRRVIGLSLEGCLENKGSAAEADSVTRKLLASYPNDPDVLYQAGQMYGKLSSMLYLRLVKVAPHSARGYQVLADAAASDGRWKDAIAAYRKAVEAGPTLPGLHFHLALLLAQYSSEPDAWKQAIDALNKELQIAPHNAAAEYELALIWHKHGQIEKAIAALQRALKFQPSFVEGRLALAKMLSEQNRKREALAVLEPARQTAPNNPSVHYMLARLYMQLGESSAAQREEAAFEKLKRKSEASH